MSITAKEAIARLDGIDHRDPERAHIDADAAKVAAAYERLVERCDGWWYA